MPYAAIFDATNINPEQMGPKHPPGNKFPATITGTDIKDTKDGQGKYFEIIFTTPAGSIRNNYNLWNSSKQAMEIAAKQLSAVCHATGIFKVDMNNDGMALRNAKLLIDIGFQAGQEPSAEKPEGGYVEVKKIYDVNGNEPGKVPAQPSNPAVQSGNGASWGGSLNPPTTASPSTGWQQGQGGAPAEKPPWG